MDFFRKIFRTAVMLYFVFTDLKYNIMADKLKVIVDSMEPYIGLREKNSTIQITGYVGELWNIIESKLHLESTFIHSNFNVGKNLLTNGSVDILLIPVIVTVTDVDGFDFSFPVVKSWYELYIKRKGSDATSVSYLETWSPGLWSAFLITILLLTVVLWFMLTIRKTYSLDDGDQKKSENIVKTRIFTHNYWRRAIRVTNTANQLPPQSNNKIDLCTCFFIVLGSIANQGFLINTKSSSMRLVILVSLFFGLVMFNSYSAVLVSRLAVGKPEILFPNLQSVVERGTHTICVREQSYAYLLFKDHENDTQLTSYWRPFINQMPCRNITKIDQIAHALCKDNTVILEAPNILATILETYKHCMVTRMPGRYAVAYASLLMRKQLQYTEQINDIIQRLTCSGILDYLQKKWLSNQLPQSLPISNDEPVTMRHIKGVLIVYWIAVFVSFITFLIEKFSYEYKSQRKIQNRTLY